MCLSLMLDALEAVDLLDFVHQVLWPLLDALDVQDVVGVGGAVRERLPGPHVVALVDRDVLALGDQVFLALRRLPGVTTILRLPLVSAPKDTTPSISVITAVSLGLRTSKSSATRGRPPVMSLVLVDSRGDLGHDVAGEDHVPIVDHDDGPHRHGIPGVGHRTGDLGR